MFAGIYLVSACGSAEEFVAAFRRYADRAGLFVPVSAPLPQGKRGRIALTLKDGGVMLEGEAEVVQSSAKSPLHGRAGMMLKFIDLDEPSKTMLAELEKARLAMKPAPPSMPPRPADVPAEPRPVVPAIGGRIDAANALAECVVIGDVGALEEVAGGPPKAGPKFVVPSIPVPTIPALGGARAKTPTGTPPEPAAKPEPSSKAEQRMTTMGMPALRPPGEASGAIRLDPTPVPAKLDPTPVPVKRDPTPVATREAVPAAVPKRDTAALDAEWDAPAGKSAPAAAPPAAAPTPPAAKADPTPAPKPSPKAARMTQIGFPIVKAPADGPPRATTLGVMPLHAEDAPSAGVLRAPAPPRLPPPATKPPLPQPTPTRTKAPTAPPRQPTPVVPLPVAKLPAKPAPMLVAEPDVDEKTDLSNAPLVPETAPESGSVLINSKPPEVDPQPARPARSGGMRASEILAAVHTDDWTMTPDASGPTLLPAEPPAAMPDVPEPTPAPGAPPTGDWTMSLDPAAGWSKPEKVETPPVIEKPTKIEKRTPIVQTPATGNPVKAVSSDRPIDIQQWEDKPTSIGAKIEIDATLMEPLDAVAGDDELPAMPLMTPHAIAPSDEAIEPPPAFAPSSTGREAPITQPPPAPLPPAPTRPPTVVPVPQEIPIGYAPTLLPGQLTAPMIEPPPMAMQYATAQPGDLYRSDAMPIAPSRSNKKLLVIVASAMVVVAVAVVLALTLGKHKKPTVATDHHAGSALVVMPGSAGTTAPAVVTPDTTGSDVTPGSAAPQVVTPTQPTPPTQTCAVDVATTPAGAEVSLEDKTVLGTTPGTFQLPCGTATKLKIQKAKYLGVVRSVTPAASGTKLAVTLGVGTFAVKVTSTPPGATILVGGRSKGVTPASVQLPAFQTVTVVLTKEGYAADSHPVIVKTNGQMHHVVLKKSGKSPSSSASHGLKGI